mmetsp:Transcript_140727/g.392247  ORF Transcript_140727/g.392247 Transcript_140727/m.392247 type:complete len:543 (-) Transcript_140727:241-1869(-)
MTDFEEPQYAEAEEAGWTQDASESTAWGPDAPDSAALDAAGSSAWKQDAPEGATWNPDTPDTKAWTADAPDSTAWTADAPDSAAWTADAPEAAWTGDLPDSTAWNTDAPGSSDWTPDAQSDIAGGEEAPGEACESSSRTPNETLTFPKDHFKSIIGPGGATINSIRKVCKDVIVKKLEDCIEVYITGKREKVELAKKMIQSIAYPQEEQEEEPVTSSGGSRGDRHTSDALKLELSAFGSIVGHGGAKIKDVRQQSGAQVSIEKQSDHVYVKISGTAEQVSKAKAMINSLAGIGDQPSQPAERSEALEFERAAMGSIIGPGGRRITDVRKKSGAEVSVKKVEDRVEVAISGSVQGVEKAMALINDLVEMGRRGEKPQEEEEEESSDDEETMNVRMEEAKQVIGKQGAMIKRIRTDSGATIQVDEKTEPSPIHISGTVKTVDRARAMIFDVIAGNASSNHRGKVDWEDEEFMKISYEASKKLIGKAGARVSDIEKKSWARVEVGKSTGEPVLVRITGSFDAVEQACSMIEETLPGTFHKKRPLE